MTRPRLRARLGGLGVTLALATAGAAPAQEKQAAENGGAPTWYAQALAHGDPGLNVTYLWSKGPKLRSETVIAGHRIVTIVSGEFYHAYDVVLGTGVSIRRSPNAIAQDAPGRRPFGNELESLLRQGAEKVREEKVAGRLCDMYRVTDDLGRRALWVSKDEARLPVRLEIYNRLAKQTRRTEFLSWLSGLEISDSFFVPEPGVDLETWELSDWVKQTSRRGPQGPVPILYADLLHGRRKK